MLTSRITEGENRTFK